MFCAMKFAYVVSVKHSTDAGLAPKNILKVSQFRGKTMFFRDKWIFTYL